jgi:hypothetical protein
MKKLIYIITITLLSVWSCARFDDSKIWEEFDNYYERLEKLEAACDVMNSNISALQAIVTALQGNDYVTGVAEIVEDGVVVGYSICFSKSGVVKIYHGEDGADGADGAPGADGRPGADGADGSDGVDGDDGHSPVVGVRKDTDGVYYWTIDGEWMLDDEGQKVPATGKDGADASAGSDGKDGMTPLLKIEDGYWFVSYNGGSNWTKLYKAVGENGADGATGAPGQDGADGKDGESFFQGVDTSSSEDYIILTLADGTQIKLPTWKAFEELQTLVNKLNTNLSALQTIVEVLQNNDYVTGITPITKDGVEIGYTIDFSKSKSITVYHGKDGADGSDGAPGQNGEDGEDGKDGYTPVLGVKPADDDWSLDSNWNGDSEGQTRYYWTLDGEWLLDSDGNRIPANGVNGNDGANGSAGKNGTSPKLKIENGNWYISLDGGQTWQPEPLGPATAVAGESIFTDISYDSAYLYVTLQDGTQLCLSRNIESASAYISIGSTYRLANSVTFTGKIEVNDNDLPYTQITLYYSDSQGVENFNIYQAEKISVATFDYNGKFEVTLDNMKYGAKYTYCLGVTVRSKEVYTPIKEFSTDDLNVGELETAYENGTFTGSGYFYTDVSTSIINGYGAPMLKKYFPDHIDGIQFYIIGIENGIQPLTAFVGYLTDKQNIGTFKIIKEKTVEIEITTGYSKTIFPIKVTRDELKEIPDDGMLEIGFYPPSDFDNKPVGIGFVPRNGQWYEETKSAYGIYYYKNVEKDTVVWQVSSTKNPRYFALMKLTE